MQIVDRDHPFFSQIGTRLFMGETDITDRGVIRLDLEKGIALTVKRNASDKHTLIGHRGDFMTFPVIGRPRLVFHGLSHSTVELFKRCLPESCRYAEFVND